MKKSIATAALILSAMPLPALSADCNTSEANCQGNAIFSFDGNKSTCCLIFRNDGSNQQEICIEPGQQMSIPVRSGAMRSSCLDAGLPLANTPRQPISIREANRTRLITIYLNGQHVVEQSPQVVEVKDVICDTRLGRITVKDDANVPLQVCVNSSGYARIITTNVTNNPPAEPLTHGFLKPDEKVFNW